MNQKHFKTQLKALGNHAKCDDSRWRIHKEETILFGSMDASGTPSRLGQRNSRSTMREMSGREGLTEARIGSIDMVQAWTVFVETNLSVLINELQHA